MEDWSGRASIAKKLTEFLGIRSVKVVAGNCDIDMALLEKLTWHGGSETIYLLKLAMAKLSPSLVEVQLHRFHFISKNLAIPTDLLFIAARGGVGEDIGLQANVIAASFAEACGGTYSTFYYPESLSEEAHKAFRKEPFCVENA